MLSKSIFVIFPNIGDIIVNNIYTPITAFIYFLLFPLGYIISIMLAIITATIICSAHVLRKPIIKSPTYLYISPLLDIFITNVTPIISITETVTSIASNILNVSPIP